VNILVDHIDRETAVSFMDQLTKADIPAQIRILREGETSFRIKNTLLGYAILVAAEDFDRAAAILGLESEDEVEEPVSEQEESPHPSDGLKSCLAQVGFYVLFLSLVWAVVYCAIQFSGEETKGGLVHPAQVDNSSGR